MAELDVKSLNYPEEQLWRAESTRDSSSAWPKEAKYSLWLRASELPLHHVRERLEVGHLEPRDSQSRFRVINQSSTDGTLPLVTSALLRAPRHGHTARNSNSNPDKKGKNLKQAQRSTTLQQIDEVEEKHLKQRKACAANSSSNKTSRETKLLEKEKRESNNIARVATPKRADSKEPSTLKRGPPRQRTQSSPSYLYLPTPPSRLGTLSLHDWFSERQPTHYNVHTRQTTQASIKKPSSNNDINNIMKEEEREVDIESQESTRLKLHSPPTHGKRQIDSKNSEPTETKIRFLQNGEITNEPAEKSETHTTRATNSTTRSSSRVERTTASKGEGKEIEKPEKPVVTRGEFETSGGRIRKTTPKSYHSYPKSLSSVDDQMQLFPRERIDLSLLSRLRHPQLVRREEEENHCSSKTASDDKLSYNKKCSTSTQQRAQGHNYPALGDPQHCTSKLKHHEAGSNDNNKQMEQHSSVSNSEKSKQHLSKQNLSKQHLSKQHLSIQHSSVSERSKHRWIVSDKRKRHLVMQKLTSSDVTPSPSPPPVELSYRVVSYRTL